MKRVWSGKVIGRERGEEDRWGGRGGKGGVK